MESRTYLKNLKVTPKKARFYLAAIKKMKPNQSLKYLFYARSEATRILRKAIESAVANAVATLKVEADLLNFKLLTIEEGQVMKRYKPGARGNVQPIKKRTSHIKIILEAKDEVKPVAKIEKKETEKSIKAVKATEPKKTTELKIEKKAKK